KRTLRRMWRVLPNIKRPQAQISKGLEVEQMARIVRVMKRDLEVRWKRLILSQQTRLSQAKPRITLKASVKPKRIVELKSMSSPSSRTKLPLDVKNRAKTTLKLTTGLKAMLKPTGMRYLVLQLKQMAGQ
ncbi:hypothetical protein LTR54_018467, partial [Friedmanniomyces endolithicus]